MTEQPTSAFDNDREARAIALRFAIDVTKDFRNVFAKEVRGGSEVTEQIVADAAAFYAFLTGEGENETPEQSAAIVDANLARMGVTLGGTDG